MHITAFGELFPYTSQLHYQMDKNDNTGVFTVSLLKSNQESCRGLLETLEKDVAALRTEARHGSRISSELDSKLEWFNQITNSLSGKIRSLWSLAELRSKGNNEIKDFADQIFATWERASKQVCKEYARIRVASRTMSGTPLTTLLDKIRKRTAAVKVSLRIGEVIYDQEDVSRGYLMFKETVMLLKGLHRCDDKVQRYLVICKMTPYLLELESAVDKFVSTTDMIPSARNSTSQLTVFPIVMRLLTGELLGYQPDDTAQVLAANAPRKPVFITKNTKRKMDIPTLPAMKMPRNSSYLSSFR